MVISILMHEGIAEVIEPTMTRAFYVQVADDDLS